jgi:serine/threonine protein kinase/ActR/RegA family two-component response regulator
MTKVLVIEDDPAIRANIVDLLEIEGFETVQASNGRAGVDTFRREQPDLVICDLKLPELDGFGVLEALRNEPSHGDTPFIFLSAHAERAQIRQGMKLGADDYIPKPFTSRELLDAISGRLARHERIRSSPPPAEKAPAGAFTAGHAAQAATTRPVTGQRYGSYRIVAPLGAGGMGAVYVAEHVLIGKKVAIKVLLPQLSQSKASVARFFNEARTAASIRDPGIIDVFDFGYDTEDNAYIVMELLEGESLRAHLTHTPRPTLAFVLSVAKQIARATAAAHAQRIVHRDLKPDNVYLLRDPEMALGFREKVLDFGVAKLGGDDGMAATVTKTGALLGTPHYMSPEQCRGLGEVDARADVYALGCILYELFAGHPPFFKGGMGMIVSAHIYEPVPPLAVAQQLPPALVKTIMRALEKDVSARQRSMQELLDELSYCGALPRVPRTEPWAHAPSPLVQRSSYGSRDPVLRARVACRPTVMHPHRRACARAHQRRRAHDASGKR